MIPIEAAPTIKSSKPSPLTSTAEVTDGLDDLIIGAAGVNINSVENVGRSYVVFGKIDSTVINYHPSHRR
jgi:hypothetical protein